MPFLLLFGIVAGVGALIALGRKAPPGATPAGGSLQGPGGLPLPNVVPLPIPPLPPPVVQTSASLRQGNHYHFLLHITFDPNAALQDLLAGHIPAGLVPTSLPIVNPDGTVSLDALWSGQDGTILSTLDNAVVTFLSATELMNLPNPIALPGPGPGPLEPLPPGLTPLPPNASGGLFGAPVGVHMASFGPHVAGIVGATLSQYHPNAGSGFRQGLPQVAVGATLSGYNPHDVMWAARNYPRAAGTKGGYG
jgi:hypothetical protein